MKFLTTLLTASLSILAVPAWANADHRYVLADTRLQLSFDVYNDGRNTYVEAAKGVVVRGAVLEGDSFVLQGVPNSLPIQLNGKKVTVLHLAQDQKDTADGQVPAIAAIADRPSPAAATPDERPVVKNAVAPTDQAALVAKLQSEVRQEIQEQFQAQLRANALSRTTQPVAGSAAGTETKRELAGAAVPAASLTSALSVPTTATAPINQPVPADTPKAQATVAAMRDERPTATQAVPALSSAQPLASGPHPGTASKPRLQVIKRDRYIDEGLAELASNDHWVFIWHSDHHYPAINDIDLSKYKTADEAAEDIVYGLREEGKPIELLISEGNNVMEVFSTEVKND